MTKLHDSLLQTIAQTVLLGTALITPLLFLPITADFFSSSKTLLLVILASVGLLTWTIRGVLSHRFELNAGPATAPALILGIVYLVSSFMLSPNPRLTLSGETGIVVSLVIIFITTASIIRKKNFATQVFRLLVLSTAINAVITILEFVGLGKLFSQSLWLSSRLFNFTGGPITFLSLALPVAAGLAYQLYVDRKNRVKLFNAITFALITVASLMSIRLLSSENFQFMPLDLGWIVAVRAMQNPQVALLGTGPTTFANVYTQLKPAGVNGTLFWNVPFSTASNLYLQLMTTVGLSGLGLYLLATISSLVKGWKTRSATNQNHAYVLVLATALLLQLFLPFNLLALLVTFVSLTLLALESHQTPAGDKNEGLMASVGTVVGSPLRKIDEKIQENSEKLTLLYWFVFGLSVIGVLLNGYQVARAYASEVTFYQSLKAAEQNDGGKTYELQNSAVQLNPYNPQIRMVYSQTNFQLAAVLASQKEVSEKDKLNITQLIQQSIREAKVAIQLDQSSSVAWHNLAQIYRQLIGLVEGADGWTVQAYQQAIALDPTNPQLILDLGGVYFGLGKYPEAISIFGQAVQLKQDWPNSYYNLAVAYKAAKQPQQALEAMRVVVQLLDPASADYQKAQDELNALQKEVDAAAPTESDEETPVTKKPATTLNEPETLPTPDPEREIELPADAAPESTPTP